MLLFDRSHTISHWRSIVYGPIFYRFRQKAGYWSKMAIFHISLHLLHNNSREKMVANIFGLFLWWASHRFQAYKTL